MTDARASSDEFPGIEWLDVAMLLVSIQVHVPRPGTTLAEYLEGLAVRIGRDLERRGEPMPPDIGHIWTNYRSRGAPQ